MRLQNQTYYKALMKALALIITFSLMAATSLKAQEVNKALLDSLFDRIEHNHKGMNSIALSIGGKEVYTRSIGFADVEQKIRATSATTYHIGSISKMFTAVLIMQLIEQDKLSLNTPLARFFPEVENADKITIEHLLRHQSGLYNITEDATYTEWLHIPHSRADLLKRITSRPNAFQPGTQASYSNSNFILLTFILEDITGLSYAENVQNNICRPCMLTSTYVDGHPVGDITEAKSYFRLSDWEPASVTHPSIPSGAGAVVSTPKDLNAFQYCLHHGNLVQESTLAQMMRIDNGFGIGMFTVPFYEYTAYGHTGGIDGFVSQSFYFPNNELSLSLTANGVDMEPNDILIGVLSIVYNKPYDLPEFKPLEKISEEEANRYSGVYSSPSFPLKITVFNNNGQLMAQGTGQSAFPLTPTSENTFVFEPAQVTIVFFPEDRALELHQAGTIRMTKE